MVATTASTRIASARRSTARTYDVPMAEVGSTGSPEPRARASGAEIVVALSIRRDNRRARRFSRPVPLVSAQQALHERHLVDLLVGDRSVPEVAALAEQLAVIRRDDDPRPLRYDVEQPAQHAVDVRRGAHLPGAEPLHVVVVEERGRLVAGLRVERADDAVHAGKPRPFAGVLV